SSIEFIEGDLMQISYPDHSFDYIIALDVLEHINNLDDYILLFKKLLKPGGSIIVSGPTENFLYKIGRKLAGEKFTGDYHVNNIHNIKKSFSKSMDTKTLRKLIWPFTLFELFVAREGAV
ncbi:MAG TPA: methyltransferase domain-containing protein, partial [Puia sp.]|nr:methyltransferase domain-containing protein [Puia sp.]